MKIDQEQMKTMSVDELLKLAILALDELIIKNRELTEVEELKK